MTTDMVERVARAIANQDDGDLDPRWLRKARAAIEAMMEPTEGMLFNGWTAENHTTPLEDCRLMWKAMLRKSLEE